MTDSLLAELRVRFRETTQVRLQEVARLLDALDADVRDADALQRLARHFHALAGLGATYGYPRVSELGDAAEATILPLVKTGSWPSIEMLTSWRTLIDDVNGELRDEHDAPLPSTDVPHARRRVLVVDDDLVHIAITRRVLANAGYDVEVCSEAGAFDESLAAFAPDVVLMDVQLADVSGEELARRAGSAPVIFVTGDREARGADGVVAKPVVWDVLLARIAARLR